MAHVVVRMSCRIATSIIGLRPFIAVTGADPKQPFDSADSAADHPPDGPSDRARRVVSDGGAMGGACGDALRPRCERRRKSCDQGGRQYAVKPALWKAATWRPMKAFRRRWGRVPPRSADCRASAANRSHTMSHSGTRPANQQRWLRVSQKDEQATERSLTRSRDTASLPAALTRALRRQRSNQARRSGDADTPHADQRNAARWPFRA